MERMGSFLRHVLVVGAKSDALERIAPMLRRAEFSVHTAEPSPVVFDLVLGTSFELVLVSYPLRELDLDDFIDALRRDGSWCRKAALVLLAEEDHLEDAGAMVDLGVNRAVGLDWPEGRLHQAIADLLEVAPRISLRVLVHLKVEVTNQSKGPSTRPSMSLEQACFSAETTRSIQERGSASSSASRTVDGLSKAPARLSEDQSHSRGNRRPRRALHPHRRRRRGATREFCDAESAVRLDVAATDFAASCYFRTLGIRK